MKKTIAKACDARSETDARPLERFGKTYRQRPLGVLHLMRVGLRGHPFHRSTLEWCGWLVIVAVLAGCGGNHELRRFELEPLGDVGEAAVRIEFAEKGRGDWKLTLHLEGLEPLHDYWLSLNAVFPDTPENEILGTMPAKEPFDAPGRFFQNPETGQREGYWDFAKITTDEAGRFRRRFSLPLPPMGEHYSVKFLVKEAFEGNESILQVPSVRFTVGPARLPWRLWLPVPLVGLVTMLAGALGVHAWRCARGNRAPISPFPSPTGQGVPSKDRPAEQAKAAQYSGGANVLRRDENGWWHICYQGRASTVKPKPRQELVPKGLECAHYLLTKYSAHGCPPGKPGESPPNHAIAVKDLLFAVTNKPATGAIAEQSQVPEAASGDGFGYPQHGASTAGPDEQQIQDTKRTIIKEVEAISTNPTPQNHEELRGKLQWVRETLKLTKSDYERLVTKIVEKPNWRGVIDECCNKASGRLNQRPRNQRVKEAQRKHVTTAIKKMNDEIENNNQHAAEHLRNSIHNKDYKWWYSPPETTKWEL